MIQTINFMGELAVVNMIPKGKTLLSLCRLFILYRRPVFKRVSDEVKNLIHLMLQVEPTERASASECLLHPWVTGRCHTEMHKEPLPEVQEAVRARLERRRKRAEALGRV